LKKSYDSHPVKCEKLKISLLLQNRVRYSWKFRFWVLLRDERAIIFAIQIQSVISKSQCKTIHSPTTKKKKKFKVQVQKMNEISSTKLFYNSFQ